MKWILIMVFILLSIVSYAEEHKVNLGLELKTKEVEDGIKTYIYRINNKYPIDIDATFILEIKTEEDMTRDVYSVAYKGITLTCTKLIYNRTHHHIECPLFIPKKDKSFFAFSYFYDENISYHENITLDLKEDYYIDYLNEDYEKRRDRFDRSYVKIVNLIRDPSVEVNKIELDYYEEVNYTEAVPIPYTFDFGYESNLVKKYRIVDFLVSFFILFGVGIYTYMYYKRKRKVYEASMV